MADDDEPAGPALRIAQVCPYSLSRPGGVQSQAVGLARALGARGHTVTLVAPLDDPSDAPADVEFVAAGRSVRLPANGSVAPVALSPFAAAATLRAVRARRFDVLHVHEPFAPGLGPVLLAARGLPPVVATFHRSGASLAYRALRPVTAPLARRAALRCAVSEAAARTVAAAIGSVDEVLFNAVDVARARNAAPWPTERPAVLFLGRHEARKGLAVLLDAFERVLARRDAAGGADLSDRPQLWIAGDGPETAALRARHPATGDVCWLGVLGDDEKDRRLAAATVLCAPSLGGESFGVVLLEAMAARTVVVASDLEGYRDAAGGTAVLVRPGDVDALAHAVDGVLDGTVATVATGGPGGRTAWLDDGSARAERWSTERLAECYEARYRRAVAGRTP